jgi:hypothetical protein
MSASLMVYPLDALDIVGWAIDDVGLEGALSWIAAALSRVEWRGRLMSRPSAEKSFQFCQLMTSEFGGGILEINDKIT